MRSFNLLDTQSFKPFYFAAETLSFTQAAQRAGLTQSGVSQHVAKLESQLGVPLFTRLNRKVLLTEAGKQLKGYVEKFVDEIELLREQIGAETSAVSGLVRYAMPASCLMSPHFPMLLADRNRRFPAIDLRIGICPSEEVLRKLLALEIDFGFVTKPTHHPAVTFRPFCPEEYVLVARTKQELASLSPASLASARLLGHPGVEVLFDSWRDTHFPKAKRLSWDSLNVVGGMESLPGVIEMVKAGLGMTVLPKHCAAEALAHKQLHAFQGQPGKTARQLISIVTLTDFQTPRRVQTVIDSFLQMKGKPAPAA